jgi:hypothetical protein
MTRRAIALDGTDAVLEISKYAVPKTSAQFIHLDRLTDGTWRLLVNVEGVDIADVQALRIIRED